MYTFWVETTDAFYGKGWPVHLTLLQSINIQQPGLGIRTALVNLGPGNGR